MKVIFQSHHAVISPRMRRRAEIATERAAQRLSRTVDAIVRFEQDGPLKRVEIVLHAPRQRKLVALGEARYYGPALTAAIGRLSAQVRKVAGARKSAGRSRVATETRKLDAWKRGAIRTARA